MNIRLLKEPSLEFANGNLWVCPKEGIRRFTPYDMGIVRPDSVKVGIIGRSDSVEMILPWLAKGGHYIEDKGSKQPKLFPSFMGFHERAGFCSRLVYDESYLRKIRNTEFDAIYSANSEAEIIERAVDLYLADIKFLSKNKAPDVILCVIPESFVQRFNSNVGPPSEEEPVEQDLEEEQDDVEQEHNFRRMLKAKAMKHHIPIQIVRKLCSCSTSSCSSSRSCSTGSSSL